MNAKQILEILKVLSWIVFIGLCIKTGAMFISFFVSLFINADGASDLYMGLNLSELLAFNQGQYVVMAGLIIFLSGLKAYLFYQVIRIISKLNMANPFNEDIANLIAKLSGISLQIGITAIIINMYAKWLLKQVHFVYEGGGTEFLYLAGILFVIAVIFKRGMEIQAENDLTV